ncbi:MAG: DUF1189 domain-containing protein [Clostridia bacterium]|nr:DUF1189 domain-containing protein [Clostridia bacterium]
MSNQTEKEQKKNIPFFKKIVYSITKFEKYPEMSAEGTASAFKYLALLMLVFSIIVSSGLVIELQKTIKSGVDYLQNQLPDVNYTDGQLNVDSSEVIKIDSQIPSIDQIIIDTNTDSEEQLVEYINSIPQDNTGIVLLKNKAVIKAIDTNQVVEYSYKDILENININKDALSKQDIINYLSEGGAISIYVIFFILMILYVFSVYLISVLVDTLLITVLGIFTVWFTKLKLKLSAIYNMSIYALTLSIILNALYLVINSITGFEMRYFQIMYISIAYVYMVAAIFLIRIDFEKKQAELMKIMEEQEKVRKEIKEKEHEQEEEKKENKKPEEGKEKNGDELGQKEEPNGSEA